jgi:hypothetical protein
MEWQVSCIYQIAQWNIPPETILKPKATAGVYDRGCNELSGMQI